MTLKEFFTAQRRVAIAFSGGVDSAYLLYAAAQYASEVRAYCARSAFQPAFELDDARQLAESLSIRLRILEVDVLADAAIAANPADRCYHCKKKIFSAIREAALADGFSVLLDGTNASDEAADRPGMAAAAELEVLSPLRLCGLTKRDVRRLSREAGLPTWDKPAYACLATRIPTGTPITAPLLSRTERAETALRALGLRDFRVRTFADSARIQVTEGQLPLLLQHRDAVLQALTGDYRAVLLDLEVRDEE